VKGKASTPICPFVNEKAGATIMKEAERRYQKIREERREVSVHMALDERHVIISQQSRLLWFFLEGGPKPYSITFSINTNVDQLKATIQQRVKILRDTVDPDDLTLLKVVSLIPRACAF
jgi:hypothetical protein